MKWYFGNHGGVPLGASSQGCCEGCGESTASSCHTSGICPHVHAEATHDCTGREEGFGTRPFLPDAEPLWQAPVALWHPVSLARNFSELRCPLRLLLTSVLSSLLSQVSSWYPSQKVLLPPPSHSPFYLSQVLSLVLLISSGQLLLGQPQLTLVLACLSPTSAS